MWFQGLVLSYLISIYFKRLILQWNFLQYKYYDIFFNKILEGEGIYASGFYESVRPIYTPIKSLLSYDMFGTRQHPIVYVREN